MTVTDPVTGEWEAAGETSGAVEHDRNVRLLIHRLNNQLGIIIAHAELLENKAVDEVGRARAAQVIRSALDAMSTTKELRQQTEPTAL